MKLAITGMVATVILTTAIFHYETRPKLEEMGYQRGVSDTEAAAAEAIGKLFTMCLETSAGGAPLVIDNGDDMVFYMMCAVGPKPEAQPTEPRGKTKGIIM